MYYSGEEEIGRKVIVKKAILMVAFIIRRNRIKFSFLISFINEIQVKVEHAFYHIIASEYELYQTVKSDLSMELGFM